MDEREDQQLHAELGKIHELALVFTWIAGLLNILAVWDAIDGPAYGYGDEPEPDPDEESKAPPVHRPAKLPEKPGVTSPRASVSH